MDTAQAPPASGPKPAAGRSRILDFLIGLFVFAAVVIAALPFVALAHGAVVAIGHGFQGLQTLGVAMSLVALGLGALFFVYSVKYYLATVAMLISSLLLSGGNGHANGNGLATGTGQPHGLMRLLRRRNGNGYHYVNGNGNGNGHINLGYEPFVSIHIATYNEKRVIGRLLEACAALEYGNYEVIVVDDSTDETTQILEAWNGRPGFKLVHRTNRDGFKGGALSIALLHMDPRAEFVIVWDADVVPFPDSIQTYLPHFFKSDNGDQPGATPEPRPEVAAVQSYQWHVLNKSESWLTEAVRAEYAGSYMVERPFQEFMGSLKMVAGTAFMIRADLLRELGWGRSLTEDWELTLRLYARGFKVVYTPYAESPAECVATFGRLARQRMRWAEGHTYNVRRWFTEILGSRRIGFVEKVGFLFYSTYYLQAALFIVGTTAWLVAEIGLHAHIPEWTATLGWSLLLSNLISLPLMNFAGLLLEGAPAKDFIGIVGALATSFLLVPFQAYAALKGLLEKDEGPWYRTPKTGLVTDPVQRLRRLKWLRRWLGPLERRGRVSEPSFASARPPARPARRLAWVVVAALSLALAGIGYGAFHAPIANAAGTTYYMHDPAGRHMDGTAPGAALPKTFSMAAANDIFTWSTPSATLASQTISSATTFQFNYWTTGLAGATSTANLTFGYSATPGCGQIAWVQNVTNVNNGTNLTATLAGAVAAGDLLVGIFRATSAPPTVTDNVNGAWTEIGFNGLVSMWYFQGSAAAAAGTLTVTLNSAGAGTIRMSVDEFAGVAAAASLDQTTNGASVTATWTAAASAAIPAGELVAAGIGTQTNTEIVTPGTTNGAVMTLGGQQTSVANGTIATEYTLSSVAGSQNSTMMLSAPPVGNFSGVQATFRPLAGSVTPIATSAGVPLALGLNQLTATFSPASNVVVPAGSYFCYSVRVTSVTNGGLTLDVDALTMATALISSQTIFIPELVLPFVGLAVFAPLAARWRRSRRERGIYP
jgi:cellulose synthase/poly-beta-1,6-N-acetylglucosamine synthase-like glycosyltransferase